MRLVASVIALCVVFSRSCVADCDETIGKLIAAVPELTLTNRATTKDGDVDNVTLSHPSTKLELICLKGDKPGITSHADTPFFASERIKLLSTVGAAETGLPLSTIRRALEDCVKKLPKVGEEQVHIEGAWILCERSATTSYLQVERPAD